MLATLGKDDGRCPEALRAGRGGMVVSAVLGGRLEGGTETRVFQSVDRKYFEVKLEARCSCLAVSSCPQVSAQPLQGYVTQRTSEGPTWLGEEAGGPFLRHLSILCGEVATQLACRS